MFGSDFLMIRVRFCSASEYFKKLFRVRFEFCKGVIQVLFGSVLGKIWVLVRFVLAGFGFFPISTKNLMNAATR